MPSSDPEEDLAHLHLCLPRLIQSTSGMVIKDQKSSLTVGTMASSANSVKVDQAKEPSSQKLLDGIKSRNKPSARVAKKRILASSGNFSFVCRICSKEFPSGRALAGHMRVHGGLEHATAELNTQLQQQQHQQQQLCAGGSHSQGPPFIPGAHKSEPCLSTEPNHVSQLLCVNQNSLARSVESVAMEDDQEPLMVEEEDDDEEEIEDEDSDEEDCHKSMEASQYTDGDADAPDDDDDELFRGNQFRMIPNRRSHAASRKVQEADMEAPREARHEEDDARKQLAFRIKDDDDEAVVNSKENIPSDGFKRSTCQLYELRHNPKRSRLLTDQEFHNQAFVDIQLLGRSSRSYAAIANSVEEGVSAACGCVCPVCSKEFPSQKSLFGHMRCHPERDWRGIQPPVATKPAQYVSHGYLEGATAGSSGLHSHGNHSESANPPASDLNKMSADLTPIAPDPDLNKLSTESSKSPSSRYVSESETSDVGINFQSKFTEKPTQEVIFDVPLHQRKENLASLNNFAWRTVGKRSHRRRRGCYMAREISSTHETALTSENTLEALDEDEEEAKTIGGFRSLAEINNGKVDVENTEPRLKVLHSEDDVEKTEPRRKILSNQVDVENLEPASGKVLHNEDDDIASCLLLLSAGEDKPRNQKQTTDEIMNKDSSSHASNILHKNELADGHKGVVGSPIVRYKCSICKKSFSSPQALGGHRASHKKKNESCGQASFLTSVVNASGENDLVEHNASKLGAIAMPSLINTEMETDQNVLKSTRGHECSICHRVFPTGQALGGHKRRHWTGDKTPEHASSAASNNQEHLTSPVIGSGAQKMIIDLNLPAPVDAEEDEVVDYTSPLAEENAFDAKNSNLYHNSMVETKFANQHSVMPWKEYFGSHKGDILSDRLAVESI